MRMPFGGSVLPHYPTLRQPCCTCKVQHPPDPDDACWVPHHVGHGAVHHQVPQTNEDAQGTGVDPAGEGMMTSHTHTNTALGRKTLVPAGGMEPNKAYQFAVLSACIA